MLLGMQGHADTLGHAEPDSMKEAAERNREDSIIARVLDGDIDSYRFLVNKYSARVLAFCRMRMRSEEDAQDASQEVFVRHTDRSPLSERREFFRVALRHRRQQCAHRISAFASREAERSRL